jgi:hypothetical protein
MAEDLIPNDFNVDCHLKMTIHNRFCWASFAYTPACTRGDDGFSARMTNIFRVICTVEQAKAVCHFEEICLLKSGEYERQAIAAKALDCFAYVSSFPFGNDKHFLSALIRARMRARVAMTDSLRE